MLRAPSSTAGRMCEWRSITRPSARVPTERPRPLPRRPVRPPRRPCARRGAASRGASPSPRSAGARDGSGRGTQRRCGSAGSGSSSGSASAWSASRTVCAPRRPGAARLRDGRRPPSPRLEHAEGSSTPCGARSARYRADDRRRGLVLGGQSPELDEPHRRSNLVQAVVEAGEDDVVAVGVAAVPGPRSASSSRASAAAARCSASSASPVTTMPPSPTGMFLFAKKLKHPRSPIEPTRRPPAEAPGAWAASSISAIPCRVGELPQLVHLAREAAVVESDDRLGRGADGGARRPSGSRFRSSPPPMSQNTGVAPVCRTTLAAATKFSDGSTTSSPGPQPDREQRQVERRRPVGDRERVLGADELREGGFELGDPGAHAPPAGEDRLPDRGLELRVDHEVREWDLPGCLHRHWKTLLSNSLNIVYLTLRSVFRTMRRGKSRRDLDGRLRGRANTAVQGQIGHVSHPRRWRRGHACLTAL